LLEEDLTDSEKFILWCTRKNLTVAKVAVEYGVSKAIAKEWKTGQRSDDVPQVKLLGMDPHEHYHILRVRSGMTEFELSRRLNIPVGQVCKFEYGNAYRYMPRMIDFWEK
jgi:DNA-binding transcriptional regulator YiaG